jgi:hypothetical protein
MIYECWRADPVDGITPQSKIADDICAVVNEWFQALPTPVEQQRDRSNLLLALVAEFSRAEKAAYRAGREDLLHSGSCPECAAGDPHNEPDVPHIHLTPYGYLLYAADHERPGFIEEIRAVERRAGREDAAREAGLTCQDEAEWLLGPRPSPSSHFHECIRERGHPSTVHRCQCGMSWRPGNQRSDGVQPTEDAARDALIIRGDLDITTVVAALDRAGFDCPDDALGNASADLLQRLPVWQGSDGMYRPRIPKVDQPGVQPTEEQRAEDQERDEGQG